MPRTPHASPRRHSRRSCGVLILVFAVVAFLALGPGTALAGGPTSVLVVSPEKGVTASAYTSDAAYAVLMRALESNPTADEGPRAGWPLAGQCHLAHPRHQGVAGRPHPARPGGRVDQHPGHLEGRRSGPGRSRGVAPLTAAEGASPTAEELGNAGRRGERPGRLRPTTGRRVGHIRERRGGTAAGREWSERVEWYAGQCGGRSARHVRKMVAGASDPPAGRPRWSARQAGGESCGPSGGGPRRETAPAPDRRLRRKPRPRQLARTRFAW
jgi:hypothetical protein